MSAPRVLALFVHPVKSLRGISVETAAVTDRGFARDRRWMVVDEAGVFRTQREIPRMTLVSVELDGDALVLTAPGVEPLRIEGAPRGDRRAVRVWDDTVEAVPAGPESAAWLTRVLGAPSTLVHMPDDVIRPVDPAYAEGPVSFADGLPYLIAGQASLEDLAARTGTPLGMRRFRPNLVIAGSAPYAEDDWAEARIGGIRFALVKPCARCSITTVDPETAERGKEPLATLATYRKGDAGVLFGVNAVARGTGTIRVGDPVEPVIRASTRA